MITYVESNFLLEITFGQAEAGACEGLLELAEQGRIELAVPSFALVEPLWTLPRRVSGRNVTLNAAQGQLREIQRNAIFRGLSEPIGAELAALFWMCEQEEEQQLERVRGRLLAVATVLPLDSAILREASRLRKEQDLGHFDALMLASVLADLARRSEPSIFLNRNYKDFSTADIERALDARRCEFFGSFETGLMRVRSRL